MITLESKIYIAGHKGMVGSAIYKALKTRGYTKLISKTSKDLDLRNQADVNTYFEAEKPDVVIDAAARVGGILANNNYPYNFLMENLQIQNNLIEAALKQSVDKFIFLGSSCIYPKSAPQPLKEEYLLTGALEPTNEWYAIAKIAGVKACQAIRKQFKKDFVSLMPTNLYGPHDNFDLQTSHVLPAMIRKFHDAKIKEGKTGMSEPVELWGTGSPKREFLHVEDLVNAVIFVLENTMKDSLYNVGVGKDISTKDLAALIQEIVGHKGEIQWDKTKPDGTMRKLLDASKLNRVGWKHKIELEAGIKETYNWFIENHKHIKEVKLL
jgi:GDP-L-fucose synthase